MGVFDGLPGGFEEESLLGVDGEGFAWADAEEGGVEVGGVVEESAVAGVGGAGVGGVGVVEGVGVPAAVGGEGGDGVGAGGQEVPEVVGGVDVAGVVAAHADDRDGFVLPGFRLGQPLPGLVQIRRHPLEVVQDLLVVRHAISAF